MINKISLKNYESHKDTTLELHPGINIITGESDSGKTSILRSLNWIINNRPQGLAMISDWNRDKKDRPIEETYSEVIIENNIAIKRYRIESENGYNLDGDIFEAIKSEIPVQISDIVNMSEVNIQKQHDQHFMLSWSAPDVARFLSQIIKLEQIDAVLGLTDSYKRKFNSDIKITENKIQELNKTLEGYDWIDKAEKILKRAKRQDDKIQEIRQKMSSLGKVLNEIDDARSAIDGYENLPEAVKLVETLKMQYEIIKNIESRLKRLGNLINQIHSTKLINKNNLVQADNLMDGIKIILEKVEKKRFKFSMLKAILSEIEQHSESVDNNNKIIKKLERELPERCPYCGGRLNR